MRISNDIRWKQRFQNYLKSFSYLEDAIGIENPDITQKAGIIQFFEISFELAWKTMKDYIAEQGLMKINSPRETIKKAFEIELIEDSSGWLKALVDRKLTAHTYEEETANEIDTLIRNNYFFLLISFKEKMLEKM